MIHRGVGAWLCVFLLFAGCGQKKIEGPVPETGDVSLRVLYLIDPALPALSEADMRKVLDISEKQMGSRLGRAVRITEVGRADLQTEFDGWIKPFGKITFMPRLDPLHPMPDDARRVLYARILDLLRNGRLRPMFPAFSMDPGVSDIPVILDTILGRFEELQEKLRKTGLLSESRLDRQSIFSWYTILGSMPMDSKPVGVILTNDLLIFDSLSTIPPQVMASAGVAAGYTRVYPGIALISTLPFLSDDPWFANLRGDASPERRLDMLAWAISSECGGKLIGMNQEEIDHSGCLNRVLVPPYARTMDEIEKSQQCGKDHRPLNRLQLLTDYLSGFIRISVSRGDRGAAGRAVGRLSRLSPDHPAVAEFRQSGSAPPAPQVPASPTPAGSAPRPPESAAPQVPMSPTSAR